MGSKVVIIGGGNVAMDVSRTVLRHGVEESVILYRKGEEHLPALNEEIRYAKLDGVKFEFYKSPKEFTKKGVLFHPTSFVEEDGIVKFAVDDSVEELFEADSIIIAASQGPQTNIVSTSKGIELDRNGLVVTDECGRTTREGVFAAGDVVTGARTVVEAVKRSKLTAEVMDDYLTSLL